MTYGVTATGFSRKPFTTIQEDLQTGARDAFGAPDLDTVDPAGFLASVYLPAIERLDELWKVAEAVYNAPDPRRSTGQSYDVVSALRGVTRKRAQRGTYGGAEFTFDGPVAGTVERGAIRFNVEDQTENVWLNSNAFTIGSAGVYTIAVESELPGSDKVLNESATIEVIEGPAELTGIAIPNDEAIAGTDLEEESAWRTRSDLIISAEQTKIGAVVEDVANVVAARVVESAGEIRVIVNDSAGAADDDAIAQAIYDSKCQGVVTSGAETGISVNELGEDVIQRFDRVNLVNGYASVVVSAPSGVSEAAIKQAIQDNQPTISGQTVIWGDLYAAIQTTEGVRDTTQLFIGLAASPTETANIPANVDDQISFLDANISITVNT